MGVKLRSIARNPRLLLAYKGIAFTALLWLYAAFPGWLAGFLFAAGAGLLYANPLFNTSAFFPLFAAEMIISFASLSVVSAFRGALIVFLGCAFAIIAGLKNLALTHRGQWTEAVCYALSYITALMFFLHYFSGFFRLSWIIALIAFGLIWSVMIRDRHVLGLALLVLGEMLWVVSWLPIGFFASANVMFFVMLFLGDSLVKKRIAWKDAALYTLLIFAALGSSYWRL